MSFMSRYSFLLCKALIISRYYSIKLMILRKDIFLVLLRKRCLFIIRNLVTFLLESGPMGSSHATRGWGLLVAATRSSWRLLVAARSPWKHVGDNRLRQSDSMAKHFSLQYFFSFFIIGRISIRTEYLLTRFRKI